MRKVEELSLKEKLGQLLVFGFPATAVTEDVINLIDEYKAGNIILFAHNLEDLEQTKALCQELRERIYESTGIYPFITIDQEGGVVSRLPEGAAIFPSAMAIRASNNPEYAEKAAYWTGLELRALGMNVNLAPVLDINNNPQNPVIGIRSYGATPEEVSEFGIAATKGYMQAGVMPVAKHFPGHGDTDVDSHIGLPTVDKSEEELLECEFIPFEEAMKNGLPAIMNAHIIYPSIEPEPVPATLSKRIMQDIVRDKLGFEGLIYSDCFQMQAISEHYGTVKSFANAIEEGMDLVLISHDPKLSKAALENAEKQVELGALSLDRINESVERVLKFKQDYTGENLDEKYIANPEALELIKEIIRASITRLDDLGDLPKIDKDTLFIGSPANRTTFASSDPSHSNVFPEFMGKEFSADSFVTSVNPDQAEIDNVLAQAKNHKVIVYGTYNAHLNKEQIKLAEALQAAGHDLVVVALRNPYDLQLLSDDVYKIAAFDYTVKAFDALVEVFNGGEASGVLPLL